jgi:hypothetical protein
MSHLETCDHCRTAADETKELVLHLGRLPKPSLGARFADRVMARVEVRRAAEHLGDDDLDLWVEGRLPEIREVHLRACPECQVLADAERTLVLRLQALPLFNPGARFDERIMDRVNVPITSLGGALRFWRTRVFANPLGVGMAAGVAVLLGGSMAASAAWAAAHQDAISGVVPWLLTQGKDLFWQGVGSASAVLQQQPWYQSLRAALTPGRIALVTTTGAALYAAGVFALRRLLALPSAPQVSRALP